VTIRYLRNLRRLMSLRVSQCRNVKYKWYWVKRSKNNHTKVVELLCILIKNIN